MALTEKDPKFNTPEHESKTNEVGKADFGVTPPENLETAALLRDAGQQVQAAGALEALHHTPVNNSPVPGNEGTGARDRGNPMPISLSAQKAALEELITTGSISTQTADQAHTITHELEELIERNKHESNEPGLDQLD